MSAVAQDDVWGLVLAGGDGTRLQALTRILTGLPIPKQYCRLAGDRSLLEMTLDRIAPFVPPARTLAIVNQDHVALAGDQLRGLPPENILVQPANRGTGPGLLFGLLPLAARAPDAIVTVFPTDHYVRDEAAFRVHLTQAVRIVRALPEKVVLLGVQPDRPEPGYGYLDTGRPLGLAGGGDAFRVRGFVEKPSTDVAAQVIMHGGLWNSFVMACSIRRILVLLRETCPAEYLRSVTAADAYETLPCWNFSHDFLARVSQHLVAVRMHDVGWSDWGTREEIERTLTRLNVVPAWRGRLETDAA